LYVIKKISNLSNLLLRSGRYKIIDRGEDLADKTEFNLQSYCIEEHSWTFFLTIEHFKHFIEISIN